MQKALGVVGELAHDMAVLCRALQNPLLAPKPSQVSSLSSTRQEPLTRAHLGGQQSLDSDRPASMDARGADADLGAEAEPKAVSKASAGIRKHARAVDVLEELGGRLLVARDDAVGVAAAKVVNVLDGRVDVGDELDRDCQIAVLLVAHTTYAMSSQGASHTLRHHRAGANLVQRRASSKTELLRCDWSSEHDHSWRSIGWSESDNKNKRQSPLISAG